MVYEMSHTAKEGSGNSFSSSDLENMVGGASGLSDSPSPMPYDSNQSVYNPAQSPLVSMTYPMQQGPLTYTVTVSGPLEALSTSMSDPLNNPLSNYSILPPIGTLPTYSPPTNQEPKSQVKDIPQQMVFVPSNFIKEDTPQTEDVEEVMKFVEEAYFKTTGKVLSKNTSITLCSKEELAQAHSFYGGEFSEGVLGFCVNRPKGLSHVFVKRGSLAQVLLTIGHELGHLESASLGGVEEEAKAYAFSMAWMFAIREHNIANLQDVVVTDNPAQNGLHNVAFAFVCKLLRQGERAIDVFKKLVCGLEVC